MSQPFPDSPNYRAVLRGLLQIHRLTLDGRFESAESDAIRDAMDAPWEGLSEVEKKRISGLSEDLNVIAETPTGHVPPQMNPQAQGKLAQAYELRQRGEWDRALELLRRWGKYVTPALASYVRGSVWLAAGDPEAAVPFFEHAQRLEPGNTNYHAILLHALRRANPAEANRMAEEALQAGETPAPSVMLYAADILYESTKSSPEPEGAAMCRRLIPILEDARNRLEGDEDVGGSSLMGMALAILATCYERLGDTRRAYDCYSQAIRLDPTNDALLIARGQLGYGTNPQAASDFEEAVRMGSSLVWPYAFLAHHYLANYRYEDCRVMCERGLLKQATSRVKSGLWEFLAISQAGLGYPEAIVRGTFEKAIRADLSNERARRNLERFEQALNSRTPQPSDWERGSEEAMRLFGREEAGAEEALVGQRQRWFAWSES